MGILGTERKSITMSKKMSPDDPCYFMLDNPNIPRTPVVVYRASCYICRDDEFARMGLPLCRLCPGCETGHIAADDTRCDDCGVDQGDAEYEAWLESQGK